MRTQVGIVGAGPAGLLLSHLLHLAGIRTVVLESHSRAHVESRIRAGVLEQPVERLLVETGVGARMQAEGLVHHGVILRARNADHRIDFKRLTGGYVRVYSQHKLVQDLIATRLAAGGDIRFEAEAMALEGLTAGSPSITYRKDGAVRRVDCDVIAGCDGFHGISRTAIPSTHRTDFDRVYPFSWLGILADAAPSSEELVYATHPHGFALLSMRSPTVSRLYLQCAPDEELANWSGQRIWDELSLRLARDGFTLARGPITQRGVTQMRSFVTEPMRHGKLFLVGDAAHIVPPTGAKGLNLAAADVAVLARALTAWFDHGDTAPAEAYSATCLRRVWRIQRFSWWMTSLLHRFPDHTGFERRTQEAELDSLLSSEAAQVALTEVYTGLPLDL